MTPYYQRAGITIWNADCREVLPTLETGSVDAVVTDPPFGINWSRATWADDSDAYAAFMREWIAAIQPLVRDGPVFVWQAGPQANRWHEWFPEKFRIMAGCKGFVQFRPTPVQWAWDPIIFWGTIRKGLRANNRDYFIAKAPDFRKKVGHPTVKPLDMVRYVVNLAAAEGQTVLDPFGGSGTTLVACTQLGLHGIGIEIEERYCEIAAKRLEQETTPLALELSE